MATLDGTPVVGSHEVTIDSVTYILGNITVTHPSNVVEDMDEDGAPARAAIFPMNSTLTADFQFASSATACPSQGDSFTEATGDLAGTWQLTNVTFSKGQQAIKTGTLAARKKINA